MHGRDGTGRGQVGLRKRRIETVVPGESDGPKAHRDLADQMRDARQRIPAAQIDDPVAQARCIDDAEKLQRIMQTG